MVDILIKKTLEEWLQEVDYSILNSLDYVPTKFALTFLNFVKLVNGSEGESNKTPPMHLAMLDKLDSGHNKIVNLVFRGAAKTTLFMEYLSPFIALTGGLPRFGDIRGMLYLSDSMDNGVKNARKNIEFRYNNSEFLQDWLPNATFTDPYLEFHNKDKHPLGIKMFGAKTGLRGSKVFGKRPTFAVLDDLIGDGAAESKAEMEAIKNTVYKGVEYALDPQRNLTVFNGTPFNKEDIIIEAVESGGWHVNVWPVAEKFPCTKEEFRGAWEDRFTYDDLMAKYRFAEANGKTAGFYQELMLQINADDERLVQEAEINWYSRKALLKSSTSFNFYITTDFATSEKERSDNSVISVWAYNANGDWFWVDGMCERQTMDKNIHKLFEFVAQYRPQEVGIETSGQQGAFISWLQSEMINRNQWFNFSRDKSGNAGIKSGGSKMARFNLVVPLFKAGKMFFPEEMRTTKTLGQMMSEIRLATINGLKGKDDSLDTISQLMYLNPWKPTALTPKVSDAVDRWEDNEDEYVSSSLTNYIV